MKWRTFMSRYAVIITTCLLAFVTHGAAPALTVVAPRGGEVYVTGQKQTVLLGGKLKAVTLELSRDGGATFELLGIVNNTVKDKTKRNNFAFTVTGAASSNCMIRAKGTGTKGE